MENWKIGIAGVIVFLVIVGIVLFSNPFQETSQINSVGNKEIALDEKFIDCNCFLTQEDVLGDLFSEKANQTWENPNNIVYENLFRNVETEDILAWSSKVYDIDSDNLELLENFYKQIKSLREFYPDLIEIEKDSIGENSIILKGENKYIEFKALLRNHPGWYWEEIDKNKGDYDLYIVYSKKGKVISYIVYIADKETEQKNVIDLLKKYSAIIYGRI